MNAQLARSQAEAEYHAALDRHANALAGLDRARHVLELAEREMDAAESHLAAHEAAPGIPAYAVRDTGEREPVRLDGCTCRPVNGSHRPACQWAMR